jgi:hypothetical protein
MAGIYLRQGDTFIAMRETPYEAEAILQKLVAEHPEMLAGNNPGANVDQRWLLVERESPISEEEGAGGRWSADHLFIDQDGVPTVVETKRSSDPRARREVVAQMLDYAANGVVSWRAEALRARFEARCATSGLECADVFIAAMGDSDPETFWAQVHTNLGARRLRLVFVADAISPELERIVDFVNEQMEATEVLAIEIKQFVDEAGAHQTIVPRVLGQTQAARRAKRQTPGMDWTRETVLAELKAKRGPAEAAVAHQIFEWASQRDDRTVWFGSGRKDGSFQVNRYGARRLLPFALYTYGRVEVHFQYLARRPPFDDERLREELRQRLNAVEGIDIPTDMLALRPSIPISVLAHGDALVRFLAAMDWAFDQPLRPFADDLASG